MSALVTDSDGRQVLAIIRSLGEKGISVTAGDIKRLSIGFFSRFCKKKLLYPNPDQNPEYFKKGLLKYISKNKIDVLIPVSNSTVSLISQSLKAFAKYTSVPIPPHDTIMKAMDKSLTMKTATSVPRPATFVPTKLSEVHNIAKKLNFPAVIKPKISSGSRGLRYVNSSAELIYFFNIIAQKYDIPIIQEYIPGDEIYGVSALLNKDSNPRAVFVHKRIRQFPIKGGPSTYRVSVSNKKLAELGLRILEDIEWYGVAMTEFKMDPRDGKPKLIEINPRFWGSLSLAIFAGIDFPYLLYKLAVEGDIKPTFNYRVGVKTRYLLFGDIFCFLASANKLALLPEMLALYEKDLSYDIWRRDDPLPAFIRLLNGIRHVSSRDMWEYAYFRA
ncbi:MAG: ATP-grasp domain-containing protein [Candidatus Bathyarchaeota archaeon]|nr:MAG: ATP-grasp domain-containing protein [Candidatus Bathyarchaeota archaeon]